MKSFARYIALLCLAFILFAPAASAYDARFPGKGSRADYNKASKYAKEAEVHLDNARPKEALVLLEKAVSIYPYDAASTYNLGNCYADLDQPNRAIENYKKAISLDPSFHSSYTNLADQYIAIKNYSLALQACKKSLSLKPNDATALVTLGQVYIGLKQPVPARRQFEAASKLPTLTSDHKAEIERGLSSAKYLESGARQ